MCGTCHLPEYMQEDEDDFVLGEVDDWSDLYELSTELDATDLDFLEWLDEEEDEEDLDG